MYKINCKYKIIDIKDAHKHTDTRIYQYINIYLDISIQSDYLNLLTITMPTSLIYLILIPKSLSTDVVLCCQIIIYPNHNHIHLGYSTQEGILHERFHVPTMLVTQLYSPSFFCLLSRFKLTSLFVSIQHSIFEKSYNG